MIIKITCPWCRRRVRPTKRGRIWTHNPNTRESTGEFLGACAGSGRLPSEWNDLRKLRMSITALADVGPPLPGDPTAQAAGCTCSALDNNRGRWAPCPPDGWLVALDCPLHRKKNPS